MEEKQELNEEQVTEQVQTDVNVKSESSSIEQDEKAKQEIAGLNRKISELTKAKTDFESKLKQEQLAKMTEKERIEEEKKQLKLDREELKKERRLSTIDRLLYKNGLDPEKFAKRVHGDTSDEIAEDIKELKELFDTQATNLAKEKINKSLSIDTPKGGKTPPKMTEEEIEKLPTRRQRMDARKANGYIK